MADYLTAELATVNALLDRLEHSPAVWIAEQLAIVRRAKNGVPARVETRPGKISMYQHLCNQELDLEMSPDDVIATVKARATATRDILQLLIKDA